MHDESPPYIFINIRFTLIIPLFLLCQTKWKTSLQLLKFFYFKK